tara:strand:- start:125 stop:493 length:369 start_codon:yes stop_codon:yes gene_type:complete
MNINDQDYALVFELLKDNKGKWTGDIDGNIVYSEYNRDTSDTKEQMMNMLTLLTTCVKLLETDKGFIQQVWEARDELGMQEEGPDVDLSLQQLDMLETLVEDKPQVLQKEGNVIKLNFTKRR